MPKRLGDDFSQLGDQIAQQQGAKWKIFLATLPGLIIFLIAGAQPTTAFIGGFGIVVMIMPAIIGRSNDTTERYQRTPLLMGAALLAYAAGIQVVINRLGLNADQAEEFAATAFRMRHRCNGGVLPVHPVEDDQRPTPNTPHCRHPNNGCVKWQQ